MPVRAPSPDDPRLPITEQALSRLFARGMDGPRIGAAIGVGKSAISNWRNGYAAPAYENLDALTRLAGMVLRLESADPDKASRMDVSPDERALIEELRAIRRLDADTADDITANLGDQLRSWRSRLAASGRASG